MNRFNSIILILMLAVSFSCRDSNPIPPESHSFSMNERSTSVDDLRSAVILKGDTNAYKNLRIAMLDYPPESFIFCSFHMANKFRYPRAHLDYFNSVVYTYQQEGIEFDQIDLETKKKLVGYLEFAAQTGLQDARQRIDELNIRFPGNVLGKPTQKRSD